MEVLLRIVVATCDVLTSISVKAQGTDACEGDGAIHTGSTILAQTRCTFSYLRFAFLPREARHTIAEIDVISITTHPTVSTLHLVAQIYQKRKSKVKARKTIV